MRRKKSIWCWGAIVFLSGVCVGNIMPRFRWNSKTEESDMGEENTESSDDCGLCGNENDSLNTLFRNQDMLGIICINNWYVLPMNIYGFYGKRTQEGLQGSMNIGTTSTGEGGCTFQEEGDLERGISRVKIEYGTESGFNREKAEENLCRICFEKLTSVMKVDEETGVSRDICLVDFQTMKLYSLQECQISYYVRDYYIQLEKRQDGLGVLAVYVPKTRMPAFFAD